MSKAPDPKPKKSTCPSCGVTIYAEKGRALCPACWERWQRDSRAK